MSLSSKKLLCLALTASVLLSGSMIYAADLPAQPVAPAAVGLALAADANQADTPKSYYDSYEYYYDLCWQYYYQYEASGSYYYLAYTYYYYAYAVYYYYLYYGYSSYADYYYDYYMDYAYYYYYL